MTTDVDLAHHHHVHVIGVGGAGMSAIASVLHAMGHAVTGSDLRASAVTDRLIAEGIGVSIGHAAENLENADLITRSTAVSDGNSEVRAALGRGLVVHDRASILSAISRVKQTIAVAGTHGKTTTSSMLALVLGEAGFSPSFIIGGELHDVGSGAAWSDDGDWFVVEADESDGTFLALAAHAAIVTSVEPDHLGHYGDEAGLVAAFESFASSPTGPVVLCADDAGAAALAAGRPNRVTYGTSADADWHISNYVSGRARSSFSLSRRGQDLGSFDVATPGLHNVRNATAAVAAAVELGADVEACRRSLRRYAGVARRFQFRGERDGITYVDDYAHLPTEVEAALEAAGAGGWDRVVCVFQPHRYSRTRDLAASFASSFGAADVVIVTEVYSAGEQPIPGVGGELVADAVRGSGSNADVRYIGHRDDILACLNGILVDGDLCLTLGAGDLTTLADELLVE